MKSETCREQSGVQPSEQDVRPALVTLVDSEFYNPDAMKVVLIFLESLMHNVLSPCIIELTSFSTIRKCVDMGIDDGVTMETLERLLYEFERRRLANPISGIF
jgi:hypothetical protein